MFPEKEIGSIMSRKVNVFWAALTVFIVVVALVLCFIGSSQGILFARPQGNPQDAVTGFFNSLKAGNYTAACQFLDNYSSLGLENTPESEEGQIMLAALKKSYDYSLSDSIVLDGAKASQKILVRYLDLNLVDQAARALTGVEYNTALRQVLTDSESLCTSDFFDVTVSYVNGTWLMTMTVDLLTALQGGRN